MASQPLQVDMYVLRYQRLGRVIEVLARGTTGEDASNRYLAQSQAAGVDVSDFKFLGARQLKRLGHKA